MNVSAISRDPWSLLGGDIDLTWLTRVSVGKGPFARGKGACEVDVGEPGAEDRGRKWKSLENHEMQDESNVKRVNS